MGENDHSYQKIEDPRPNEIIVIDQNGDRLQITVNWDADAEKMANTFRSIMFWMGFHPNTIEEFIPIEDK